MPVLHTFLIFVENLLREYLSQKDVSLYIRLHFLPLRCLTRQH